LEGDDPQPPPFEVDFPVSVVHIGPAGAMVLAGDDHILVEILGRSFQVTASAFFQVNTAQAEAMIRHLMELIPDAPLHTALDVYCGAGLFSAFLAPNVGRLVAIELSPAACADFAVNLDEFDHVELYQGLAEQVLPALKIQASLAVIDPPRSGLDRAVVDALIHLAAPLLIYVSCDPATLARDTRRLLEGGYRLRQVTPFDLFPQTYAIESISMFVK
jgi:23S rRNA (uracil1939-C5)-methyltransferase